MDLTVDHKRQDATQDGAMANVPMFLNGGCKARDLSLIIVSLILMMAIVQVEWR